MTALLVLLILLPLLCAAYAYAIYPLLLVLLSKGRKCKEEPGLPEKWPAIDVVMCAYNAEHTIGAALSWLVAATYPRDRRRIIVVSDGSTDRTEEIVESFVASGVELVRMPRRLGKTAAENAVLQHLSGEIVVNTDASVRVRKDALIHLVRGLKDHSVGVASARNLSVTAGGDDYNRGESWYVSYDMWIRKLETRMFGIVGASGCLYAIRRHLHELLIPEHLSRDFASALTAREHGYRAVLAEKAVCFVPRTRSLKEEYSRKVRTISRGLSTLFYKRQLLNPVRYGLFSWMLISHKLCRWLTPLLALLGLAALAVVSTWDASARLLLAAIAGGVLLALLGMVAEGKSLPRFLLYLAYILLGNLAAVDGWLRLAVGEKNPKWEPTRREAAGTM